jgi:hypothetical protein
VRQKKIPFFAELGTKIPVFFNMGQIAPSSSGQQQFDSQSGVLFNQSHFALGIRRRHHSGRPPSDYNNVVFHVISRF